MTLFTVSRGYVGTTQSSTGAMAQLVLIRYRYQPSNHRYRRIRHLSSWYLPAVLSMPCMLQIQHTSCSLVTSQLPEKELRLSQSILVFVRYSMSSRMSFLKTYQKDFHPNVM